MKYFWNKVKGLNADVERHRAKEAELDARIAELEARPNDPMAVASLRTYRRFRAQLLQSKAEVVDKIGKKSK
jgi:BMFP domain-containing protein YqiC